MNWFSTRRISCGWAQSNWNSWLSRTSVSKLLSNTQVSILQSINRASELRTVNRVYILVEALTVKRLQSLATDVNYKPQFLYEIYQKNITTTPTPKQKHTNYSANSWITVKKKLNFTTNRNIAHSNLHSTTRWLPVQTLLFAFFYHKLKKITKFFLLSWIIFHFKLFFFNKTNEETNFLLCDWLSYGN